MNSEHVRLAAVAVGVAVAVGFGVRVLVIVGEGLDTSVVPDDDGAASGEPHAVSDTIKTAEIPTATRTRLTLVVPPR